MSDYSAARRNMVESQIRPNQVTDARLLRALLGVQRELFVPEAARAIAYMDDNVPIGVAAGDRQERRLLAPMQLARLIQLADVAANELVLDIGCGTGYSTAVLAQLAESVVGLESDARLAQAASQVLTELGVDNAAVVVGPLPLGYPNEGPFDVIVLNGSVPEVPGELLRQLKRGGRLVGILADGTMGRAVVFTNSSGKVSQRQAFDASGPILPGFEREKRFVF